MNTPVSPRCARGRLTMTLALFALVALPAFGRRADEMTYTLQRAYKLGDVDRYKMSFRARIEAPQLGGATELAMDATIKETTREVQQDGTVLLEDTVEKAGIKFGDQESDLTGVMPKVTQKHSKQGRVIEVKLEGQENPFGQGLGTNLQGIFEMFTAFYPEKPVKIGDAWKLPPTEHKLPNGTVKITMNASLTGKETVKGIETLKLKVTREAESSGSSFNGKMRVEAVVNLDPKDGKVVRISGKTNSNGPIKDGTLTFTRLLGDEKDEDEKKPADKGEKKGEEKP